MLITKTSLLTGKVNTLDLPVTKKQMERYNSGEYLIQNVFPELTPAQREFIKTGITPEEWQETFHSVSIILK